MIKLMVLISRKAGLSREAFRTYYEEVHAQLAKGRIPHLVRYQRNHVTSQMMAAIDCDVITEFWYDLDGRWEDVRTRAISPELAAFFGEDEERFMDRSKIRVLVVDELETPPDEVIWQASAFPAASG